MFQRVMSVRPNHRTNPNFINRLLGVNFRSMHLRGDWVLKPFMQVLVHCPMCPHVEAPAVLQSVIYAMLLLFV